jgi:hypothetical protein
MFYYTSIGLSEEQLKTVERLYSKDNQVALTYAYLPEEAPRFPGRTIYRVYDCTWLLLEVHERSEPSYEFIVTILCSMNDGRNTVWRIHHPQWVPYICVTHVDTSDRTKPYPHVYLHFQETLDPEKTNPLNQYFDTLIIRHHSLDSY